VLIEEKTVQLWPVADGRSDAVVPLRSERGSDALLTPAK
jgi:hypothetical protein